VVCHQQQRQRGKKIYSLHAPGIECIAKSKSHKPRESLHRHDAQPFQGRPVHCARKGASGPITCYANSVTRVSKKGVLGEAITVFQRHPACRYRSYFGIWISKVVAGIRHSSASGFTVQETTLDQYALHDANVVGREIDRGDAAAAAMAAAASTARAGIVR
jgi:hypothetical protein